MARLLNYPRRGEIYLANFDPTVGSEIRKIRPALIIQNDIANQYSPITIVAAISSKVDPTLRPTEAQIDAGEGGLKEPSVVLLNQIRSFDRSRLIKRLGRIRPETLKRVNICIARSFGLIET